MNIGIISDTHDMVAGIEAAFEVFKKEKVGLVLHCGDWIIPETFVHILKLCKDMKVPVRGVFGNNDYILQALIHDQEAMTGKNKLISESIDITVDGKRICVYHGHDKALLQDYVTDGEYDVVCTGHTHKAKVYSLGDTLVINPGSTAFEFPRRKDDETSVAIYNTKSGTAEVIYLN